MTRFVMVRHGETEGNQNRIYRGRWDLPLNERGQWQVQRAGEALKSVELSAVYTSPLIRARQTAQAVAGFHGMDVMNSDALVDIDFGNWTRESESSLAERYPDLTRKWKQAPHTMTFPDGESLQDVRSRVTAGLMDLGERHPGQTIVLASHRVPIKVMLCVALGLDDSAFWKIKVDTASISIVEKCDEDWCLLSSNDTCHLEPMADRLQKSDF